MKCCRCVQKKQKVITLCYNSDTWIRWLITGNVIWQCRLFVSGGDEWDEDECVCVCVCACVRACVCVVTHPRVCPRVASGLQSLCRVQDCRRHTAEQQRQTRWSPTPNLCLKTDDLMSHSEPRVIMSPRCALIYRCNKSSTVIWFILNKKLKTFHSQTREWMLWYNELSLSVGFNINM